MVGPGVPDEFSIKLSSRILTRILRNGHFYDKYFPQLASQKQDRIFLIILIYSSFFRPTHLLESHVSGVLLKKEVTEEGEVGY